MVSQQLVSVLGASWVGSWPNRYMDVLRRKVPTSYILYLCNDPIPNQNYLEIRETFGGMNEERRGARREVMHVRRDCQVS